MISKLVCIAALATFTFAQNDRDALELKDAFDDTADKAADMQAKIAASEHGTGMIADGVAAVDASVAGRLSTLTESIASIGTDANAVEDGVNDNLDLTRDYVDAQLAATKDSVSDQMKNAIQMLSAQIAAQKQAIDDAIEVKLDARTAEAEAVVDQLDTATATLASRQKCAEAGHVFNAATGACIQLAVDDKAGLDRVSHVAYTDRDGRDSGYVNGRTLAFEKHYDETYMRILYFDNLRVHGHTANGQWNIMICDEGGNGCAECSDPGRLENWRYSSHQYNWWMNDHVGGTIFGLCRKATNRELTKGKYTLRIAITNNRYDLETGNNQLGSFTVDEVMKY